jgi:hypothetical protein
MSISRWPSKQITDLRGAWSRLIDETARSNRAFLARNVRFEPGGRVRTRDGYGSVFVTAGKVSSMYNWVTSSFNQLIFVENGVVVMRNLGTSTGTTLFTPSPAARGITVAEAGDKAFISGYGTSYGAGISQCRVSLPGITLGTIDKAFAPPWTNTLTITDVGDGNLTQGEHKFGYIVETRTGFTGKPSPQPGDVFNPTTFTVAAGGRRVNGTMTVNTPADAAYVHPIMTRTDNPDKWYFVPNAVVAVPGGASGWLITLTFNISDENLAADAESADDHFFCLAQTTGGVGPFNPGVLIPYGKRVAYLAGFKAYVSEIDDFQFLTEDQHVVELPGKRQMVTGFPLRQNLYIVGPSWTYGLNDNGDAPATWAASEEVSSAIGTTAPQGVCWKTAGDYAWVASEAGLFLFNGRYSEKPISYMNGDMWSRINWSAAYAITVVDNFIKQIVHVAVPLDGATEPTHILNWDYQRGLDPMSVDFSYDDFSFGSFSAMCLVLDVATARQKIWLGPSAAGAVLREAAGTYSDNNATIASRYRTGHVLGNMKRKSKWARFGGADFDVSGAGNLDITVRGQDDTETVAVGPIALTSSPAEAPRELFDLTSNDASIEVGVDALSEAFEFGGVEVFYRDWMGHK